MPGVPRIRVPLPDGSGGDRSPRRPESPHTRVPLAASLGVTSATLIGLSAPGSNEAGHGSPPNVIAVRIDVPMESLPDEGELGRGHTLAVIEPPRSRAPEPVESAPPAPGTDAPSFADLPDAEPAAPRASPSPLSAPPAAPAGDQLWPEIELLLRRTDWACIEQTLAGRNDLSPRLALMLAIAQKELNSEAGADERAIAAMAGLLGVRASSASAVVTAKRLLRKPRTDAAQEQLSGVSSLVVLAIAVVTGLVGYFASDALKLLENL